MNFLLLCWVYRCHLSAVYRGRKPRKGRHIVVEAWRQDVVCERIESSSGREVVGMKGRARG